MRLLVQKAPDSRGVQGLAPKKFCKYRFSQVSVMLVHHFGAAKWSKAAGPMRLHNMRLGEIICEESEKNGKNTK